MNNKIIKKWETFLDSLTVVQTSAILCTEEEVEQAEKELGFKFPVGYKEFCLLFGSGSLGQGDMRDFFRVYCPCCPRSSLDIRETEHNLIGLKLDIEGNEPIEDKANAIILYRLLENGYAFADTDSADSFFWDLTTYRDEDQSYDIYWIPDEEPEKIKLVGRNFFDFIDKFCLGTGLELMFPKEFGFQQLEKQGRFFTAFENYDHSEDYGDSNDSFIAHLFETAWEDFSSNQLFSQNAEVKLNCGYDAATKEPAECLQKAWSKESGAEIEVIAPSNRPNIPRMVEVTITGRVTREFFEETLRKMIRIGNECNCTLTSFGSEIFPNAEP